jgi:hypothetical protein
MAPGEIRISDWHGALVVGCVIYAALAAGTFLFLLKVGRRGPRRRAIQLVVALFWPAYWPLIQGPRVTAVMAIKLAMSLCLLVALPVMASGFALGLFFHHVGRRGLLPRAFSDRA